MVFEASPENPLFFSVPNTSKVIAPLGLPILIYTLFTYKKSLNNLDNGQRPEIYEVENPAPKSPEIS